MPASTLLANKADGFTIAQARLAGGRSDHDQRAISAVEWTLLIMVW
ncbi:hypothetical protein [Aeromicrobium sp.]|nr:hypothetical protein [Aeromicrobium sp.]MBC7632688.1 hypothetical protein [Aeromicrobium sp.]